MAQQMEKKVSIQPLADRVLLKREEQKETLKGGIILPDSAKEKQETAIVIAVGPGKVSKDGSLIPASVKVGDKVLMDKYSGQEITLDDEEYIIVRSDDIIAIIK